MSRSIKLLFIISLLVSGCATTIVTKGDLESPAPVEGCPQKGSVTVRTFKWLDWYMANKQVQLSRKPELSQLVDSVIKQSNCFGSVKEHPLEADLVQFISD